MKHGNINKAEGVWVVLTHLEQTEVPWSQSPQSDDHFCCWSFSGKPTTFLHEKRNQNVHIVEASYA